MRKGKGITLSATEGFARPETMSDNSKVPPPDVVAIGFKIIKIFKMEEVAKLVEAWYTVCSRIHTSTLLHKSVFLFFPV